MRIFENLLYGAEYYDEYIPYDRLEKDIQLMKKAGMNVVRIGESTWSTYEPQEGQFDFSHVTRVLDAMERAGISVIIGTPTYAVPAWMVQSYPEVLAETRTGQGRYGFRQIMDITNPTYRFYAERIVRKLMEVTAHRSCVIGFQIDNETGYYGTSGKNVQRQFVKYLRKQFCDDLDAMNHAFGLDYWSNRIQAWEDFPDVRGTCNGSLGAAFEQFQRTLVTDFLAWQAGIVREYVRDDQFVTHNFNFGWRGYTYGINPSVDHGQTGRVVDIAGADIYHPSQENLTGLENAFGGDLARSIKRDNYLIMETQAQGFPEWLPYEGQLRLQAYSHFASGANMVEYWPWHSIHNSYESYWKGVLGHDSAEGPVYQATQQIGAELARIGTHLVNLKKNNKAAILISNEAQSALNWFPMSGVSGSAAGAYDDILMQLYDVLYRMNVECDFLWPNTDTWDQYDLIVVPALYSAPDALLQRLDRYVAEGGHLFATFKTAFADEHLKIHTDMQPHLLCKCLGVHYHDFTLPSHVGLTSERLHLEQAQVQLFMELLCADTAQVLARYAHPQWGGYAALTRNSYGAGTATYLGCQIDRQSLHEVLADVLQDAGFAEENQRTEFPMILRRGTNDFGKEIIYCMNFSAKEQSILPPQDGTDLLCGQNVSSKTPITIAPWDLRIIECSKGE